MSAIRPQNRQFDEMRTVSITRNYTQNPTASVLIELGATRVLCTASVESQVPRFLRGRNTGWVTAEYGMLPSATNERTEREAVRGKQSGRTVEIQRLIGRALRAAVDLSLLGENTIRLDCDVLQADGGTRTASITGACVALRDAIEKINPSAFKGWVAAVSLGIVDGEICLDLEYSEDSRAETDMNVVMAEGQGFVEVQGTAEKSAFARSELDQMLSLAASGIESLFRAQASSCEIE